MEIPYKHSHSPERVKSVRGQARMGVRICNDRELLRNWEANPILSILTKISNKNLDAQSTAQKSVFLSLAFSFLFLIET